MSALGAIVDGRLVDRRLLSHGRLARAFDALDGDGEEVRLVGGAVRDLVLGMPASDFDLATTARPVVRSSRARAGWQGISGLPCLSRTATKAAPAWIWMVPLLPAAVSAFPAGAGSRSEERRVGKECW